MRILAAFRKLLGIAEVRRRILWTFGLLGLFRLGSHLPLPGLHPAAIEAFRQSASRSMGALWNVLELFSGGALGKLAVGCLGIAPYITASILVQMMTRASARLEALSKEGLQGQRFLQRLTRWVTLPIAIGQAAFAAGHLREASLQARLHGSLGLLTSEGAGGWVVLAAGLVAGSFFTLWLSEQITERGLGNGQSLIILAGIVARWPALAVETLRKGGPGNLLLLGGLSVVAILGTVVVARAERRIPLCHPKQIRGRRALPGGRNYLPLRVNSAGVMPILFASSTFVLPQVVGLIPGLEWIRFPFERLGFVFTLVHTGAVFFFAYFWTFLFYSPSQIALQLQEAGSFIPGLRPGERTARFLEGILSRLTLLGAAFLASVALLPALLGGWMGGGIPWDSFLGGTSLLIVVGVGLDLVAKLEAILNLHRYGGFLDRPKS